MFGSRVSSVGNREMTVGDHGIPGTQLGAHKHGMKH